MKRMVLLLSAILLVIPVMFSQEIGSDKVPAAVKQAFSRSFPTAKDIVYGNENKVYKVGFLQGGKQCFASYNASGKLLETELAINPSALPKAVSTSAAQNFKGYTIIEAVKREAFDKGVCYEMDLKKERAGFQVRFSETGEILMQVARKEEFKVVTKPK